MSMPYVSEIRLFSFNYAPKGWMLCAGQIMSISQNQALFALLGTIYGGDGKQNFALPNLQGRVAIGAGTGGDGYILGETAGEYQHTLVTGEMPRHTHALNVNNSASGPQSTPSSSTALGVTSASDGSLDIYGVGSAQDAALASQTIGMQGSSRPHNNMMPYLALNYCIALQGVYPSRN